MSLENNRSFDLIGISDFPLGTTVEIRKSFLLHLTKIRKEKFKHIRNFYQAVAPQIPFSTFKGYLKPSHPLFQDLHIMLKVCACLGVEKGELQENILAYRFKRSRIIIKNPVLPVKVIPLLPMLVAHMIADGNIQRRKDRTTLCFSYRQYDKIQRLLLIKKVEKIFGNLEYEKRYFEEGTRVTLPEVVTLITCQYYGLQDDSFLSTSATLPEKIVGSPPKHLLAVLIAFIIDEGHIDSSEIVIKLKNEPLVRQLGEICHKLGYENTVIGADKRGMATVYVLRNGVQKFWADYLALKAEYPCVALGYREGKLASCISRFQKDWKSRGANQSKNAIIAELKRQPSTVWELAQKLDISRQGIRNHIMRLYSMGILERRKVKEAAFCYSLKQEIYFAESKKGQSQPIGKTVQEVKALLVKPQTTVELNQTIRIDRGDLQKLLNRLHAKGELRFLGWKHTGHMPTKIWQLK